jgi:hypothetical protein
LAGLAVYALSIGSAAAAFMAFMFAALPIMLLMLALSLFTATAGVQLVERLRGEITEIKRWGGYVLLLVGTGLVVLGIWARAFAQIFSV